MPKKEHVGEIPQNMTNMVREAREVKVRQTNIDQQIRITGSSFKNNIFLLKVKELGKRNAALWNSKYINFEPYLSQLEKQYEHETSMNFGNCLGWEKSAKWFNPFKGVQ